MAFDPAKASTALFPEEPTGEQSQSLLPHFGSGMLKESGIVDVQALQLPYDRSYSARISRIVEPMLRDEALQAQSANVELISGATYTSTGYAMSLQSALDQIAASMTAPA